MLLNKKNIEFCHSNRIGRDNKGQVTKMRIDKLSLVSNFENPQDEDLIYKKLDIMDKQKSKRYRVQIIRDIFGKPYIKAIVIKYIAKKPPVLLRIDYKPINLKTGSIRFDFNPQYMPPNKMNKLLHWLNKCFTEKLYTLLTTSWITRIDVAYDIYGDKLNNYLWGLARAEKSKYYDKPNGLPGLLIGSTRSALHFLCYEKVDVYGNDRVNTLKKKRLMNIDLNECKQFLRIEARIKPKKSLSKTKTNCFLVNIHNIDNPFNRLQIYSSRLKKIIKKTGKNDSYSEILSIVDLKKYILQKNKASRLSRIDLDLIRQHQVALLNKAEIWDHWPKCVKRLGVLAQICSDS